MNSAGKTGVSPAQLIACCLILGVDAVSLKLLGKGEYGNSLQANRTLRVR